ncbi:hypothetical protein HMF3257_29560 [Spirosoma telluris]|uniref:Uncharacterized protein n=1 Tax=Spirosoma telluris TaxID=2183553 RepID=A0A327NPF9_9BACT|nr:hypothetical protein HMF3257_29560 [Spirosoma telluris]
MANWHKANVNVIQVMPLPNQSTVAVALKGKVIQVVLFLCYSFGWISRYFMALAKLARFSMLSPAF